MVCPECASPKLRRSRTRNLRERFLKVFHRKPYRCLDCGWRGLLKHKEPRW